MIKLVKKMANLLGLEIIRRDTFNWLIERSDELVLSRIKVHLYKKTKNQILLGKWLELSTSQILQDVVVAEHFDYMPNGYFVEFGGADGKYLSNTYLLEKHLGWKGIIAEPARSWHYELSKNRSCNISHDAVSQNSGTIINFEESNDLTLSSVSKDQSAKGPSIYGVNSISLKDLLDKFNAPKIIDFLSIDVEGHELEVLKDFSALPYRFNFIICEHASVDSTLLKALLNDAGYQIIEEGLGRQDFWFIPKYAN